MKQTDLNEIENAKEAALKVLLHNAHGPYFGLPRTAGWGYPEPYTRDLMFSIFGIAVSGNIKLLDSIRKVLETLAKNQGCVVNIVDIHAERGLKNYPVYSIAKAGLVAMTKVLAKELGPDVRVNAIAPGAIIWPEALESVDQQQEILQRVVLKRQGQPEDIAKAVSFLIENASYMTGQVLTIDGGRTLFC